MPDHAPTWHASIPWDSLRRSILALRSWRFKAPPREGPYVVVDASLLECRRVLGAAGYVPQHALSYDKGEDLNLAREVRQSSEHRVATATWCNAARRATGLGDLETEPVEHWQYHVRGYELDDGRVALTAHWEPSARLEDSAHLAGVGFETSRAMDELRGELTAARIVWETVDERPDGVL